MHCKHILFYFYFAKIESKSTRCPCAKSIFATPTAFTTMKPTRLVGSLARIQFLLRWNLYQALREGEPDENPTFRLSCEYIARHYVVPQSSHSMTPITG